MEILQEVAMAHIDPAQYHPIREVKHLKEMIHNSASLYPNHPAFLVKREKAGPYHQIK